MIRLVLMILVLCSCSTQPAHELSNDQGFDSWGTNEPLYLGTIKVLTDKLSSSSAIELAPQIWENLMAIEAELQGIDSLSLINGHSPRADLFTDHSELVKHPGNVERGARGLRLVVVSQDFRTPVSSEDLRNAVRFNNEREPVLRKHRDLGFYPSIDISRSIITDTESLQDYDRLVADMQSITSELGYTGLVYLADGRSDKSYAEPGGLRFGLVFQDGRLAHAPNIGNFRKLMDLHSDVQAIHDLAEGNVGHFPHFDIEDPSWGQFLKAQRAKIENHLHLLEPVLGSQHFEFVVASTTRGTINQKSIHLRYDQSPEEFYKELARHGITSQ